MNCYIIQNSLNKCTCMDGLVIIRNSLNKYMSGFVIIQDSLNASVWVDLLSFKINVVNMGGFVII